MPAPPSSPADSHRGLILPSSPASLGDRPACGEPSPLECRHSPAQHSPREPGGAAARRGRSWPNSRPGASRRRGPPPGQPRGRLRARSSSTERSMGALRPAQHGSARLGSLCAAAAELLWAERGLRRPSGVMSSSPVFVGWGWARQAAGNLLSGRL